MALSPKANYLLNAINIKIPMTFSAEMKKLILKLIWRRKTPTGPKCLKKKKIVRLTLLNFKIYW